jgi:hypothetical protein
MTISSPKFLSELYGAACVSNSPKDVEIAPAQGMLLKGAIMADVGGQMVLANAAGDKPVWYTIG